LLAGTVGFVALVGDLYGVGALYRMLGFGSMALHTAAAVLLLALGTLAARPRRGFMRVLSANTIAGALARRLLPAIVCVPLVLGWLRLRGQEAGWYETAFGLSIYAVANVFCLGALAWLSGAALLRSELARRRDQDALVENERRQAAALGVSEARKTAVIESALDAIIAMDGHGLVTDFNAAAERTFGYRRADAVGRPLAELIVPARLREAHTQGLRRYLATGEGPVLGSRLELPALRADGSEFQAEVSIVAVAGASGPAFIGFVRDITEQKRAEQARRRAAQLEAENLRVQTANRLKSEFLANMSHELRTPLNSIIGFSQLLHDGVVEPVSPRQREFLGDVLASAGHLLELINDVLDLSKVEAGKMEFRPEPTDLVALVGEAVGALRAQMAGKQIRVETTVSPEVGIVEVDPARLKQVLYNYLSNALKFTADGGRVAVRVLPEGEGRFRVEVEDTGIGIAPGDVPRLFVEFQQLDGGLAKQHQGTGLGLALTRRLVEAQGGSVGVHSRPGEGSTFHAVLPRQARSSQGEAVEDKDDDDAGAPMVLVVDDDPASQRLMSANVAQLGYSCVCVADAEAALRVVAETPPAAVVLDLLMPRVDGFQFLERFRERAENRSIPVLVWSVKDLTSEERAVLAEAAQVVIHKGQPAGTDLVQVLRRLLARDGSA
jgi:PAS domain S-box-containing protein